MKPLIVIFLALPPIACVAAAAYMAINKVDGWGWFLFIAIVFSGWSVTSK